MIRNIVFDMGMVLLRWDPMLPCLRHTKGNQAKAQKIFDASFGHPDWCKLVDSGIVTDPEFFAAVSDRLADDPELQVLIPALAEDYIHDALYPIMETEKLVEDLLNEGYHLYVLSNVGYRFREYTYKIRNFDRFDGAVISAEEKMVKPAVELFNRLADRYQLNPEETVFVDDLPANVQGALNAGWHGFCYDTRDTDALKQLLHTL